MQNFRRNKYNLKNSVQYFPLQRTPKGSTLASLGPMYLYFESVAQIEEDWREKHARHTLRSNERRNDHCITFLFYFRHFRRFMMCPAWFEKSDESSKVEILDQLKRKSIN